MTYISPIKTYFNTTLKHSPSLISLLLVIFLITGKKSYAQTPSNQLIKQSQTFFYTNPDSALFYAKKALEQSKIEQDSLQIACALKTIGIVYSFTQQYKKSVSFYYDALQLFGQLKEAKQIAQTENNLAIVYRDLGLYEQAAALHLNTLRFFESIEDTLRISQVYNNLGITYEKIKDFKTALKYYNKALNHTAKQDSITIGCIYLNLGVVYDLRDQNDTALYFYQKAAFIFSAIQSLDDLASTYLNMGALHIKTLTLDSALYYQEKAYQLQEDFFQNDVSYYTQLGEIYYKKKDYQQALKHLDHAYKLNSTVGSQKKLLATLGWLRETYAALGHYAQAYAYTVQEKMLKDSLYTSERIKLVESLEIQYDVEKKEQQIVVLNDHLELEQNKRLLAEQQAKIQRIYQNVSIVGIFIALLFVALLVNRMRIRKKLFLTREAALQQQHKISELERQQLQADLEHKNRALSNLALAAVQKNEMLDSLEEKLHLLTQENQKAAVSIKPIQKLLKQQVAIEEDWNEFKIHFEEVHPDFYKKLLAASDALTQNDLKHCTYMKVKLDSKEIARIMGISPKSVQMSRYRIKKKLQLGKEDDLFAFIERL